MKLGPDRIAALVILMMVGGIAVLIIIASGPLLGGTSGTGPINEVKVIVSYDGSWSGLISNSTMSSRHNGTGTQAFIFTRSDNASIIRLGVHRKDGQWYWNINGEP